MEVEHGLKESMAYGKVVVSTTLGAEGIETKNKENIFIADTPEEFAKKIVLLHRDRKLYKDIKTNARTLVEIKVYLFLTAAVKLTRLNLTYENVDRNIVLYHNINMEVI
ncbi:hypothetical protein DRN73_06505 [Candidatus Pacearchaeota archaeon]|nr:MAG: hypothetical protein DRN73_06505 [Candidatus Pacearchaeota archaeon]